MKRTKDSNLFTSNLYIIVNRKMYLGTTPSEHKMKAAMACGAEKESLNIKHGMFSGLLDGVIHLKLFARM